MSLPAIDTMNVKIEPEWESEGARSMSEAAVHEDMSLVHKVKVEDDWQSETGARVQAGVLMDQDVKDEHDGQSEAAARAGLYIGHLVKDELVLGPESLQPRDVVFTLQASHNRTDLDTLTQAASRRACSVRLERMLVDVGRQTCRVGLQTYKFRLCLQSHEKNYEASETNSRKIKCEKQTRRKHQRIRRKLNEKQSHSLSKYLLARDHTGDKPYKCGHCSYTSAHNFHLLEHKRIHTGEKPYKCAHTHCSFASVRKSNLIRHERTLWA